MTRIIAALAAVGILAGGCTLTNSNNEPVVLTAQTAPGLIAAQMKKGCADLIAANNAGLPVAIAKAMNAAESVQGEVNTVSNLASIACSLLVPPPVVAKPAG